MESKQPDSSTPRQPDKPDKNESALVGASTDGFSETNKNAAKLLSTQPAPEPYRHLIGFALGYGIVLFFCALGLGNSGTPMVLITAGAYATVILIAVWSVFGPGPYLKRLFWSHLIGAIPAAGLALGLLALAARAVNSFDEFWYVVAFAIISIVPTSMAAQIPFWFFRGLFGWQFVYRGDAPQRAVSLRDVFVLTFVFALCFAVPQTAAKLQAGMFRGYYYDYDAASEVVTETVIQADGASLEVDRVLTADEQNQRRRTKKREQQQASYLTYGMYALSMAIVSLMSVPIVIFVFRVQETASGCAYSGLYAFGIWLICMIPFLMIGGVAQGGELMVYAGLPVALCSGAIAVPLVVTRESGFRLTSPTRFGREQNTS